MRMFLPAVAAAVLLSVRASAPALGQGGFQGGVSVSAGDIDSRPAARKGARSPPEAGRRGKGVVPGPGGLAGKQKTLGAGMLVPAIKWMKPAPTRKSAARKPDTSKDDCMSCD
jgi:hypothetical protein